jgi:dipeptidyl aminopeptidase/acylaminoacyl peptidase
LLTLYGHKGWVNEMAFSPDGKYLASISRDGTAKLWDVSKTGNEELLTLDSQHSNLNAVAYTPDGNLLAATGNDATSTIIWDVSSGQPALTLNHDGFVKAIKFSPDGKLLASGYEDSIAGIWDLDSGQELRQLVGHTDDSLNLHNFGLADLDFSPDGERLATAGEDGLVKIWDIETGEELYSLSAHPDHLAALSVEFSDDDRFLAAGTEWPSIITIWDANTGEELIRLPGYDANRIYKLEISPDSRLVAAGNNGGQVDIWRLPDDFPTDGESEAEIVFSVNTGIAIRGLSFNPSGTQILTGFQIWDVATGELLLSLSNFGGVGDAEFSPDGERVAIAGLDGLLRLFTLDLEELITLAQLRLTRSLTAAECQQYLHMEECPI